MARKHRFESPALQYAYDRYVGRSASQRAIFEAERDNAEIARAIYELREKSGLTQRELAGLVGTTPSVISRLEDAQYRGHSISMLRRIAAVLNSRLVVSFRPAPRSRRTKQAVA
ncbi:MAG: helix-turn-helix transcriptional regulator [Candidatus Zixiibacteriota bacterium]